VYDILCAKNFNPNERTGEIFSKGNPKFLLAEQLRRAVLSFYKQQHKQQPLAVKKQSSKKEPALLPTTVHQCKHCLTVYDEQFGEPENGIEVGTAFNNLPVSYCCPLCEAPKQDFEKKNIPTLVSTN
jgi:rubredoxin